MKSYDAVDVLKKLNKQKTLYHLGGREFLLIKYYKMTFIYCIKLDIWYNIFEKKRNFLKNRRRMLVAKNLKLKLARVELDMTQGDLAEAVGVTRQTIGLIEAGKYNPSLSLCQSICRCLGKTLDQLFWEEEDEK